MICYLTDYLLLLGLICVDIVVQQSVVSEGEIYQRSCVIDSIAWWLYRRESLTVIDDWVRRLVGWLGLAWLGWFLSLTFSSSLTHSIRKIRRCKVTTKVGDNMRGIFYSRQSNERKRDDGMSSAPTTLLMMYCVVRGTWYHGTPFFFDSESLPIYGLGYTSLHGHIHPHTHMVHSWRTTKKRTFCSHSQSTPSSKRYTREVDSKNRTLFLFLLLSPLSVTSRAVVCV